MATAPAAARAARLVAHAGAPHRRFARRSAPTRPSERWSAGRVAGALAAAAMGMTTLIVGAVMVLLVFDYQPMVVRSGSMTPTLGIGDVVLVRQVPAGTIEVGDIATFDRHKGGGITHRVIAIDVDGHALAVETRGDAFETSERWDVAADEVVGVVERRIPKIGAPFAWLGSPDVRRPVVWSAFGIAGTIGVGAVVRLPRRRRPAAR